MSVWHRLEACLEPVPVEPAFPKDVTEVPPPAVGPLSATQAASIQNAWAEYLGVSVQRSIGLGDTELKMVFDVHL